VFKCDALVVGGGLEGSLLALSLHRSGQKTVLLDRGRPRDPDAAYDLWPCSPFLYSPEHWRWIQESLPAWSRMCSPGQRAGVAVAARESSSWLKLTESLEAYRLETLEVSLAERFPEFRFEAGMGHYFMPRLPVLPHAGLVGRVWWELQREGVDPYADTHVQLIDWEHELPTAVTADTIFRARRLILATGKRTPALLGRELPALQSERTWLEAHPLLERPPEEARPHLWVHYARAPLYISPEGERWGLGRLQHTEEAGELDFLRQARRRWLGCSFENDAVYTLRVDGLSDGLPAVDFHPWREDCVWLAGVGQAHWPWLPHLVEALTEQQPVLPPELRAERKLNGSDVEAQAVSS
jgi:glycine/D-amino acid oxidase-like deaminating enzyme